MGDIRALDLALDALLAGTEPEPAPAIDGLVDLAAGLRSALPLEVSAAVQAAHLSLLSGPTAPSKRTLGRRIALVGLAAAIAVSMFGSAAFAASSSAAPGDALFGVKRTFERVGMALHRSQESRTAFAFEIVRRRMAELQAAKPDSRRADRARAAYEQALAEADRLLGPEPAFNEVLLTEVEEELQQHVVVLNDLLDKVPEEAREGIQRAIDNASKAGEHAARGREKHQPADTPRGKQPDRAGRSARELR